MSTIALEIACPESRCGRVVVTEPRRKRRIAGNQVKGLVDFYKSIPDVGKKVGVEIGCFWGESSEIAAQFLKYLWCVDCWSDLATSDPDRLVFLERMKRFRNVAILDMPSHKAAQAVTDQYFDLAYFDALHDFPNVSRDIVSWYPKIKMGGWIGGHDYNEGHAGVRGAVDFLLGIPDTRFRGANWLSRKTPELAKHFESHRDRLSEVRRVPPELKPKEKRQ